MNKPARLAVLVSGGGTNLQALLDAFNPGASGDARVELVVASRPGIRALDRAAEAGVDSIVIGASADPSRPAPSLLDSLTAHRIDLVVLAGYLKLVPGEVVEAFHGRMINIHPALLPAFGGPGMYGMRVHEAVIASGATVSGPTVHLVGNEYDDGPIIAQWPVPVLPGDDAQRLAARVLEAEHVLLPTVVRYLVTGPEGMTTSSFDAFAPAAGRLPSANEIHSLMDHKPG